MDEKELETDADVANADAATSNLKGNVSDKHASSNPADMDTIDYVSLLMEQEHR